MANLFPLRYYLQAEGLAAFFLLTAFYATHHFGWWLYGGFFFVPDLSMLGYLLNKRIGALVYNLAHTYVVPAFLIAMGSIADSRLSVAVGLIWCAHIGFDRMLGFGLKFESSFQETHLQKL